MAPILSKTVKLTNSIDMGNKLIFRGKLHPNAKTFSINFVSTQNPTQSFYKFKTEFTKSASDVIVHSYKHNEFDGQESQRIDWCDGPGQKFHVEFIFQEEAIYLYDESGSSICKFELKNKPGNLFIMAMLNEIKISGDAEILEPPLLKSEKFLQLH